MQISLRAASICVLSVGALMLSGCAMDFTGRVVNNAATNVSTTGSVHGGQQPVGGALITLMVPGSTGYGSAATVLATAVTTAAGGFTLPSYTCPANSGDVYLLATGGSAGAGVNPAAVEAALLGPCSQLSSSTFIRITEVTTVAAAYGLAPFATVTATSTGIGAPATNLQGLTNAFAAVNNLAPFTSGYAQAPGAIAGLVLPQAELNTLANILAGCVNSGGSTASTAPCGMLFAAATPPGGVAPVDTFQAALNIALNPGTNTSALFSISTANAPFQPTLTSAPSDFAVGIKYTGGGITGSYGTDGLAIDTAGNAWIVTGNTTNVHSITEISPAGVYLSGTTGYGSTVLSAPQGVAIDPNNNVYVTDINLNKVFKFASNGSLLSTFAATSLNVPLGIVVDTDNTLWVVNNNSATISHVTTTGVDAASSPFTAAANPFDIALNASGIWAADFANGSGKSGYLTNLAVSPGLVVATSFPLAAHVQAVSLDRAGYAWYTADSSTGGMLGRENPAGGSNFTPVTLPSNLLGLEVFLDGLNTVWVGTQNGASGAAAGALLRYSNAGTLISPAGGYQAVGAVINSGDVPEGLAVDRSGNLWMSGYVLDANYNPLPNSFVTELIGIAGPVVTPVVSGVVNGTVATRP